MKSKYFNFKKIPIKTDVWKGETNNIFHTPKFTLMRFEIKKGFKFLDKGHKSEQITIVLKGKFKLTVGNKTKILKKWDSVYIPPNEQHGGEVLEDVEGFDVFYPKRTEKKYKTK